MAKEYERRIIYELRRYGSQLDALDILPERVASADSRLTAIRAARTDTVAVAGGATSREDALLDAMVERDMAGMELAQARQDVSVMESALSRLPDHQRRVLLAFYVNRVEGYVDRLCEELFCEERTVYRIRSDALRSLAMILHGRAEA